MNQYDKIYSLHRLSSDLKSAAAFQAKTLLLHT